MLQYCCEIDLFTLQRFPTKKDMNTQHPDIRGCQQKYQIHIRTRELQTQQTQHYIFKHFQPITCCRLIFLLVRLFLVPPRCPLLLLPGCFVLLSSGRHFGCSHFRRAHPEKRRCRTHERRFRAGLREGERHAQRQHTGTFLQAERTRLNKKNAQAPSRATGIAHRERFDSTVSTRLGTCQIPGTWYTLCAVKRRIHMLLQKNKTKKKRTGSCWRGLRAF